MKVGKMSMPYQMESWYNSLPQENCGDLYAVIKWPYLPIYTTHKVPVYGQVCDGRAHEEAVNCFLHNEFPNKGKGFTYVSWEAKPYNPEINKHPRNGKIENPKPYLGD